MSVESEKVALSVVTRIMCIDTPLAKVIKSETAIMSLTSKQARLATESSGKAGSILQLKIAFSPGSKEDPTAPEKADMGAQCSLLQDQAISSSMASVGIQFPEQGLQSVWI